MHRLLTRVRRAPTFLFGVNVLCAALSLLQTLLAAKWLGVSAYGVIGLVSGVALMVFNFFDLRLPEVTTKIYLKAREAGRGAAATGSVQLCLAGTLATAVLAGATMALLSWLALPYFTTTTEVRLDWTMLAGLGFALAFVVTALLTLQRMTQAFIAAGWWRLAGQVGATALFVLVLWQQRSLTGYFTALALAGAVNAAIGLAGLRWMMRRHAGLPLFAPGGLRPALAEVRAEKALVLFGGAYGWVKMLTRGADILVFGWFASDAQTGVYRLARALADALALVHDSLAQYFFPLFMREMARDPVAVARRLAPPFLAAGLAVAGTAAVGFLVVVPPVALWVLSEAFVPAAQVAAVMAIGTFWNIGVHLWLYPMLYNAPKRMRGFMALATLAALLQLGVTVLLAWDHATAMDAGVGVAVYYTVLYAPSLIRLLRRRFPAPVVWKGPR